MLFTYDCFGEENVPVIGPAVVAANHPTYLDPILLSLQVRRPIHFMAWDKLFKVPVLGALLRAFGAFPVDVRPGQGREAYARARAILEAGEVVGIFPEGRRSRTGWLEPRLREGAARLAWETGAPLVPATIAGAFRAWPHFQSLPRPARVRVRYHEPIDPAPWRNLPEEEALPAILDELQRRVDRSLLPGVKADLRTTVLYAAPSPPPRLFEVLPGALVAAAVTLLAHFRFAMPFLAYLAYLVADWRLIRPSRLTKWIRNASAPLFLMAWSPLVLTALGRPRPAAPEALSAVVLGALFPYLYEHRRNAMDALRGLAECILFELVAMDFVPDPRGPHAALPIFLAAFALSRRTVFFRYSALVLSAYAIGVPALLGADLVALLPHYGAGVVAWLVTVGWPWWHRALRARRGSG